MWSIVTQGLSRPRAAGGAKAEQTSRRQPVCMEVPVTIHGVRLSADSGKREPFSESTRTLIVFPNGAVLRLKTAVNPGQLVAVINEHSRKVVPCEVVKSTTYQNVAGYIELKFTEPAVGFWGILSPSDQSESQSTPGAANISQAHASATGGSMNPGLPYPKAAGVERPAAPPSASTPPTKPPVPHRDLIQAKPAPLSHTDEPVIAAEPTGFPDTREAATPVPPAVEPSEVDGIGRLMFEEPKTESDQATPRRSPAITLIAAELLLGALVGGGWYWWHSRAHETVAKLSPQSANAAAPMSVLPSTNTQIAPSVSSPLPEASQIVEASSQPPTLAEKLPESREAPNAASKMPAAISHFRLLRPHAPSPGQNPEAAGIDSAPEIPSRASAEDLSTLIVGSAPQPAAPKPERPTGGKIKVARLISSAPPAYPPLARSQSVEGEVTLDALIDETGRVTRIKAISGSDLLQQAAAAAVRQWKYEPATLDGNVVSMHLTVTVKFHLH